jgi:hypothetical protein
MSDASETGLLPRNALEGRRVSLSVSDSPDLARLGLLEDHFRLALGEIARTVLTAGGTLAYGGHLRADGYTDFVVTELDRWQEGPDAIRLYLPWSVHREATLAELDDFADKLYRVGSTVYLDVDGHPIDDYLDKRSEGELMTTPEETAAGLTAMRRYVTEHTAVRVLLGGKRAGFSGRYPGLVEEAISSVEAGQAMFLAGGFGGVTHDIAKALQVDDGAWCPPWPDEPAPDPGLVEGLAELRRLISTGWELRNGLDREENRQLATTHRPSEIAALTGLGLGRLSLPS